MTEFKVGDKIILDSPHYRVYNCIATVVKLSHNGRVDGVRPERPFPHENYESNGQHYILHSDRYQHYKEEYFNEDLFKL